MKRQRRLNAIWTFITKANKNRGLSLLVAVAAALGSLWIAFFKPVTPPPSTIVSANGSIAASGNVIGNTVIYGLDDEKTRQLIATCVAELGRIQGAQKAIPKTGLSRHCRRLSPLDPDHQIATVEPTPSPSKPDSTRSSALTSPSLGRPDNYLSTTISVPPINLGSALTGSVTPSALGRPDNSVTALASLSPINPGSLTGSVTPSALGRPDNSVTALASLSPINPGSLTGGVTPSALGRPDNSVTTLASLSPINPGSLTGSVTPSLPLGSLNSYVSTFSTPQTLSLSGSSVLPGVGRSDISLPSFRP